LWSGFSINEEDMVMRKRITGLESAAPAAHPGHAWFDLGQIAAVEVTSEDPAFPIESALQQGSGRGWRASGPGEQKVRIIFDEPVRLRRVLLRFHEAESERTQEFTVRWWPAGGGPAREIVRQQWNFSPSGSKAEVEEYGVDLDDVSAVELMIRPDISGREAMATLAELRLG
jgi:hypothetical protein